eukprot:gene39170-51566_t
MTSTFNQGKFGSTDDSRILLSRTAPTTANGKARSTTKIDPGPLDHNNFTKNLTKAKRAKPASKLERITQQLGVKPFPGDLRQTQTGPPKGAVYEEDLQRENNLMSYDADQIETISAEELIHDPDFLKIDQSKLPLEMFDSLEFEAIDKTPAEWLSLTDTGYVPYYHMGKWLRMNDYFEEDVMLQRMLVLMQNK